MLTKLTSTTPKHQRAAVLQLAKLLLTCLCEQVTKSNDESFKEHKRHAEHPTRKQVTNFNLLTSHLLCIYEAVVISLKSANHKLVLASL